MGAGAKQGPAAAGSGEGKQRKEEATGERNREDVAVPQCLRAIDGERAALL